jgi:hypothetical protein
MATTRPKSQTGNRQPLLFRMPSLVGVIILVVAGVTPFVGLAFLACKHAYGGMATAVLSMGLYFALRYYGERKSFGPFYLTIIDMLVTFGNITVFIYVAIIAVRELL